MCPPVGIVISAEGVPPLVDLSQQLRPVIGVYSTNPEPHARMPHVLCGGTYREKQLKTERGVGLVDERTLHKDVVLEDLSLELQFVMSLSSVLGHSVP